MLSKRSLDLYRCHTGGAAYCIKFYAIRSVSQTPRFLGHAFAQGTTRLDVQVRAMVQTSIYMYRGYDFAQGTSQAGCPGVSHGASSHAPVQRL